LTASTNVSCDRATAVAYALQRHIGNEYILLSIFNN